MSIEATAIESDEEDYIVNLTDAEVADTEVTIEEVADERDDGERMPVFRNIFEILQSPFIEDEEKRTERLFIYCSVKYS